MCQAPAASTWVTDTTTTAKRASVPWTRKDSSRPGALESLAGSWESIQLENEPTIMTIIFATALQGVVRESKNNVFHSIRIKLFKITQFSGINTTSPEPRTICYQILFKSAQ